MLYGVKMPQVGPTLTGADVLRFAQTAERLGFDILFVGDHVVFPERIASCYPYDPGGRHPAENVPNYVEALTLLTYVAGATSSIRLSPSVLILPYRHPVLTAKIIASLDFLTRGRVILGVGAGWMREEFEALGAPSYEQRGAITDEVLEIFKVLWTQERPRFKGRFFHFDEMRFTPKPWQKPHPPIWVGGNTRPAMRRTARAGQGWFPVHLTPEELLPLMQKFRALVVAEGRDPAAFDICLGVALEFARTSQPLNVPEDVIGKGHAQQMVEELHTLARMGVTAVRFDFLTQDVDARLEAMQRFAKEVRPLAP
ncbi:MAG: LLM class F420-dependent oxidoreductase [Chloroflexi bacterium]|nr:LLM class F420-dependent oxidoreductase [Chloroflexota bacterium]